MITVRSTSRRPVRGSSSAPQLVDRVGELVAPLPAADVDDHVGVAPLGDLLQQHGLAGAEAADDRRGRALGDGEQQVEDPLAGDQRLGGVEAAGDRAGTAHRPHGGERGRRGRRRVRRRPTGPTAASSDTQLSVPAAPRRHDHRLLDTGGAGRDADRRRRAATCSPRSADEVGTATARAPRRRGRPGAARSRPRPAGGGCRRTPRRAGPDPSRADSGSPSAGAGRAGRQSARVLVQLRRHPCRPSMATTSPGSRSAPDLDDVEHRHAATEPDEVDEWAADRAPRRPRSAGRRRGSGHRHSASTSSPSAARHRSAIASRR